MSKFVTKLDQNGKRRGKTQPVTSSELSTSKKHRKGLPWTRWVVSVGSFLGAALLTFFFVKFVTTPQLPTTIIGKWKVVNGELAGRTVQFESDGDFWVIVEVDGRPKTVTARVQHHKSKLQFTWTNPSTGKSAVETHTITHINAREMTLRSEMGQRVKMIRVE
ncbi:MAG: hypothetical protein ACFCD0_00525 [Gemmataceae bacterium]